jgi:hypothetical protein
MPSAFAAGLLALACSDTAPGGAELAQAAQAIIGGLVATNPVLDHTGTLTFRVRDTGQTDALCSASLIGPQTVVTANHCLSQMAFFESFGIDVFWTPGPDFRNPIDSIPVVAAASAPANEPGFAGFGRDVGVAHLDRVSEGIPTIEIEPFDPGLLGTSMVTLGYGISSAAGAIDGLRRIGRETVSKVDGRALEGLFGDFETFVELTVTLEATDTDFIPIVEADPTLADLEALQAEFDATLLLSGYEVVTGKAPGDTQSCELDSGGPLALVNSEGTWQSYGVVSAGPRLPRPVCAFGQVFAVFGPDTFAFLEDERSWTDPCGDVGVEGSCTGDVLVRCDSSFERGVRELVNEDCAALGGECVPSNTGAACSVSAEPEDPEPAGTDG